MPAAPPEADAFESPEARRGTSEVGGESVSQLAVRGYTAMGRRSSDARQLDRALALFEQGHARDPEHLDARFGLAWTRQVKGLPEAQWRPLYEQTVDEASLLTFLSLYNLGFAARSAGRNAEAIGFLERALRVSPERADGWLELGLAQGAAGRHELALAALEKALELQPRSAWTLYRLGETHTRRGDAAQAEDAWARALELDPRMQSRIDAARRGRPGRSAGQPEVREGRR